MYCLCVRGQLRVVKPLDVEVPRSLGMVVTSWNLSMHRFLKNCEHASNISKHYNLWRYNCHNNQYNLTYYIYSRVKVYRELNLGRALDEDTRGFSF